MPRRRQPYPVPVMVVILWGCIGAVSMLLLVYLVMILAVR